MRARRVPAYAEIDGIVRPRPCGGFVVLVVVVLRKYGRVIVGKGGLPRRRVVLGRRIRRRVRRTLGAKVGSDRTTTTRRGATPAATTSFACWRRRTSFGAALLVGTAAAAAAAAGHK